MEEFSLTLTGFKTKAQVKAFIEWYEGQGEQDACVWFDARVYDGELDVTFMPVEVTTPYKWQGSNLTAKLRMVK